MMYAFLLLNLNDQLCNLSVSSLGNDMLKNKRGRGKESKSSDADKLCMCVCASLSLLSLAVKGEMIRHFLTTPSLPPSSPILFTLSLFSSFVSSAPLSCLSQHT
ncbi:hypothetical protein AMECASPLE_015122 [Ameca splendens]|uniref:Uncharacterized protein n=1 Tax=Ameca splendens TaxID=208324 RepID=A0ABV0Y1N4_9TELE